LKTLNSFVVVRNPFDSLVSLWTKKKFAYAELAKSDEFFGNKIPNFTDDMAYIQEHTFSEWATNVFIPKYPAGGGHSMHRKFVAGVNHILKFENLQAEFDGLMRELKIDIPDIPVINKTSGKKKDWRSYYDDAAIDAVGTCFSKDLERFGYSFE